jgi:hypothetical protein
MQSAETVQALTVQSLVVHTPLLVLLAMRLRDVRDLHTQVARAEVTLLAAMEQRAEHLALEVTLEAEAVPLHIIANHKEVVVVVGVCKRRLTFQNL